MIKIIDERQVKTNKAVFVQGLIDAEEGSVFELVQTTTSSKVAHSDWSRSNVFITTEGGVIVLWHDTSGTSGIGFKTFAEMQAHENDLEGIRDEPEFILSDITVNINITRN